MGRGSAGLTVPAAAAYANRHPETLRKALAVGDLHGVQRKRRGPWTIQPECIDAYLSGETCEHRRTNVHPLHRRRPATAGTTA